MSRGAFVGIVVGAAVAVAVLVVAAIVAVVALTSPRPTVEAVVGQETFDLLRLTDAEVAPLGLTASDSGHQPSTLATAVIEIQTDWRDSQGEPADCSFTAGRPGESVFPVWGSEDESSPLWKDKSVSASQSFSGDYGPVLWVTYRTFESADAATAFVEEHDDRVDACPRYTMVEYGHTTTTEVTRWDAGGLGLQNAGWVATTRDWMNAGDTEAYDIEVRVLDIQRGAVVARVILVAEPVRGTASGFESFAEIVADRMTARIAE